MFHRSALPQQARPHCENWHVGYSGGLLLGILWLPTNQITTKLYGQRSRQHKVQDIKKKGFPTA